MQLLTKNASDLARSLGSKEAKSLGCRLDPYPDVAKAVCDSLANPIGFNSLDQITVPGDQIVLAVADSIPSIEPIIKAIVQQLVDVGTDPSSITVLLPETYSENIDSLRMRSAEPVHWVCHNPDQEEDMAYLATTDESRSIFLNQLLINADLVIPIGCFRTGMVHDHFGVHTPIFPTFTNRETLAEFGTTQSQDSRGRHHKRHVHETDRIGWLLGIVFSIQLIPGRAGQIVSVIAGEVEQVRQASIRTYRQAWHHQIPNQADLVISIIDDDTEMTGWSGLVQAISDATTLVDSDGAIVILSSLSLEPGPALQAWIKAQDPVETLKAIRESKLEDAQIVTRLADLVEHRKVYLGSGLEDQTVEDLQMTPIGSESEIVRLSKRFRSALLLEGVPFVTVEITGEK